MEEELRVGIGCDSHPLVSGRRLILGGVDIPYDKGLSGWSDADVAINAIIDALCGAAGLGDLGTFFPSQAPGYKDISILFFLNKHSQMLKNKKKTGLFGPAFSTIFLILLVCCPSLLGDSIGNTCFRNVFQHGLIRVAV